MQAPETWVPIPGYENFYELSTHDRVRSLDHVTNHGRRLRGRIRKVMHTKDRHRRLQLSRNGQVQQFTLAALRRLAGI